jgi:hypothetical protein
VAGAGNTGSWAFGHDPPIKANLYLKKTGRIEMDRKSKIRCDDRKTKGLSGVIHRLALISTGTSLPLEGPDIQRRFVKISFQIFREIASFPPTLDSVGSCSPSVRPRTRPIASQG